MLELLAAFHARSPTRPQPFRLQSDTLHQPALGKQNLELDRVNLVSTCLSSPSFCPVAASQPHDLESRTLGAHTLSESL